MTTSLTSSAAKNSELILTAFNSNLRLELTVQATDYNQAFTILYPLMETLNTCPRRDWRYSVRHVNSLIQP